MGYLNQKVLGIAMALLVLAFTSCTSKPESETSQTKQPTQESSTTAQSPEQPSTTPEEAAQAQEEAYGDKEVVTVTGTVESGLDGMIISADDGTYAVSGKDLSDMEGMTVRVTGMLKESDGQRTIEATDVVIVK